MYTLKDSNSAKSGILEYHPTELYSNIYDIDLMSSSINTIKFKLATESGIENEIPLGYRIIVRTNWGNVNIKITDKLYIDTYGSPIYSPVIGSPLFENENKILFTGIVETGRKIWLKENGEVSLFNIIQNLDLNSPPKNIFGSKLKPYDSNTGYTYIKWQDGNPHKKPIWYNLRYKILGDKNFIYIKNINALTYKLNGLMYNEIYEISLMSIYDKNTYSYYSESFKLYT